MAILAMRPAAANFAINLLFMMVNSVCFEILLHIIRNSSIEHIFVLSSWDWVGMPSSGCAPSSAGIAAWRSLCFPE
jgi:hypothetical protein